MKHPSLLAALDCAVEEFSRRLVVVSGDQWEAATPCTDWNVRYLVAHVVGGNRFAALILDGAEVEEAMKVVMGTQQLGSNPMDDFNESVAAQRDGFGQAGALERLVSHPLGDISGERFLRMRVFDVAVHAWDLAVAIGHDPDLDDGLVETVIDIVRHEAPGMGFGIEPCNEVGPDASNMERLLDLSGRCRPVHA